MPLVNTLKILFVLAVFSSCVSQRPHACHHGPHPHGMSHGPSANMQYSDSMIEVENADLNKLNSRFAEEQYTALLSNYFDAETDPNGNTVYRPIMIEIVSTRSAIQTVPGTDSTTIKEIEFTHKVPKMSLVPFNYLKIGSVEIEEGEMEIEYKSTSPPEGYAQLVNMLNK